MPEVLAPSLDSGAFVMTLAGAAGGLRAVRPVGGVIDPILTWDAVSGDTTLTPPIGSAVGGGTRAIVVNAPSMLLSAPAGVAAQFTIGRGVQGAVLVLNGLTGTGASYIRFQSGGVNKWAVGRGASGGSDNYEFYNYTRPGMDGSIDAAVGVLTWQRPIVGTQLTINSTSGAGMLRVGVGVDYAYAGGQGFEVTFDATGGAGYGANTGMIVSYARGVGAGYRQLAVESSTLYLNNQSAGPVVVGVSPSGAGLVRVGGTINATAYSVNGNPALSGALANYTQLVAPSGNNKILLGNASIPTIFYETDTHSFYNGAGTAEFARVDGASGGADFTALMVLLNGGALTRVRMTAVGGAVPAGNRTLYV